ncbi:MAG: CoA-binding protein [Pleurocapsa sp. SU_196_0]|nr:CoA-binding protein [Pleurocapsa sp. SU_196_0]
MTQERTGLQGVREPLETAKTIAVLGMSATPDKPAHYVPEYAMQSGYRVIPVNPLLAGQTLLGETVRATLAEIREPVDIVDIFRRAELLDTHLQDILEMNPRPKLVWLQLGIRHPDFAQKLLEAGIEVVQDRCLMADHRNLRL